MFDETRRCQLAEDGFCVVENALDADQLGRARVALDEAIEITRRTMGSTHIKSLDPNEANIRVNNLPAMDPLFIELLTRDDAISAVEAMLGPNFLVSNFTANVALPGSGSMNIHSDQALIVPGPWPQCWAINIIWCLDDVHAANGATRYLPGSHRFQSKDEVPADAADRMIAFEAPAGSFVAMEGRLWHTSGANVTADERRRMMFAYYASDFLRQQMNWMLTLPKAVQDAMDDNARALFGLASIGNTRLGREMTTLQTAA